VLIARDNLKKTSADKIGKERRRFSTCAGCSRDAIIRGWKVGICETIRKHSQQSGAKYDSHAICNRNSDRHTVAGTCAGRSSD
jgi:hypothetical protein